MKKLLPQGLFRLSFMALLWSLFSIQVAQAQCPNNGITWTSRTSAADNSWLSVTYGNGLFVAISNSGTSNSVMTSTDGISWTTQTTAANNAWWSVTYGNGLFVAVAASGTGNRVMTSPDGINWTIRSSAADNSWNSVTYGNGLFVAVANSGTNNRVMTSPDGISWTIRTSAANNDWFSVTYGNGLFVAVAQTGTGNRVMTSPDGISWTIRASAADNSWRSVTYGNGLFVAVALSGTNNRVMTSPNGINWTLRTSAANNQWLGVGYGNGLFVAVANTGTNNRVMTSPDGITWTSRTSAADNQWWSVTQGNGVFVVVGNTGTGNRVMTSSSVTSVTPSVSIAANSDNSIATGTAVTFTATPTNGGSTPGYQWKKNGINVGTNSITYSDAALANGDIITCVLSSSDACASPATATSNSITMTVYSAITPPVIVANGPTTFCNGGSVNLTAGNAAVSFNGTTTQYANLPALGITTNTLTMEAWVYANGTQNLSTGLIFARGATTQASGLNFAFANASKIGYHWDGSGSTYNWTGGPTYPLNTWFHVALVIEPTKATIYLNGVPYVNNVANAAVNFVDVMQLAIDNCCAGRNFNGRMKEVKIWTTARTQAEVQSDITSTATSGTGLRAYYKLNESTGTTITDAAAVLGAGTLIGSPSRIAYNSYSWSPGGATTPSISATTSGTYTVTVSDANGATAVGSQAVTVDVIPLSAGTITGAATVCQGQTGVTYTVPAITNATGYTWTLPTGAAITSGSNTNSITVSYSNVATSGNITVLGTNCFSNGTVSANFAVTVNALPTTPIIIASGATTFCSGGNVVLTSSAGSSYLWSTGATTESITISESGSYTVIVTNTNSCQSTASQSSEITVNATTAITIQPAATQTVTYGNTAAAISVTAAGANLSYQWYSNSANATTGGTPIASATNSTYTPPITSSVGTLYYYCLVTGTCGSATTTTHNVTVTKAPLTITAGNYSVPNASAVTVVTNAGTYSVSGMKNGDLASMVTGTPTYTTTYTTTTAVGATGITVSVSGLTCSNANYSIISYATGTVTVTLAVPGSFTYTTPNVYTVNTAITALSPTVSAGGAVSVTNNSTINTIATGLNGAFSLAFDSAHNLTVGRFGGNRSGDDATVYLPFNDGVYGSPISKYVGALVVYTNDDGIVYSRIKDNCPPCGVSNNPAACMQSYQACIFPWTTARQNDSWFQNAIWTGYEIIVLENYGSYGGLAVNSLRDIYYSHRGTRSLYKKIFNSSNNTYGEPILLANNFSNPSHICLDVTGNVYLADRGNGTVKKIATNGVVTTIASGINTPLGVVVDSNGNVYFSSYADGTVSMITSNGVRSTIANGLSNPTGLAISPSGTVYVANHGSGTINEIVVGANALSGGYSITPALPLGLTMNAATGTISGAPTAASTASTYTVVAANATGSATYPISIAVNKVTPTISGVTASQSVTYGTSSVTLSGTISAGTIYPVLGTTVTVTINGVPQTTTTGANGVFSIAYPTNTIPYAATAYTITYSFGGDVNLNAAANNATTTLIVTKATLRIIATAQSKPYGTTLPTTGTINTNFTVTGLASQDVISSLTLTYTGSPAGNLATASVGPYTITPSAVALSTGLLSNYTVVYTNGTLTVTTVTPTISGFTAGTKTIGDAAFNLTTPISNSAGAFTYSSSNTGVATISGSTVTITGVGTSTITATQAANGGYISGTATTVLTVNPIITPPVIVANGPTTFCNGGSVNLTAGNAAVSFNGTTTQYANLPALGITTNTLTMEAWVYANGTQNLSTGLIFARGGTTPASGLNFGLASASKIGYHWANNSSTYNWNGGPTFPLNTWFHVALVIEPTKATVYLNGVPYVNNVANAPVNFANVMQLAIDNGFAGRNFNGRMKEVRIWTTARTQAEVQSDITSTATSGTGLRAYYKLNESTGTTITDAAAVLGAGTLIGSPSRIAYNSYSWSPGGATTPSISATTSGTYTVTVTDANGATASASQAVVNELPTTPTITAGGATTFCSGGNVVLTSSAGSSYLWSTGAITQSITVSASGSYTVRVTNANGCQSAVSAATTVTVNPLPLSAGTIIGAATVCQGQTGVTYTVPAITNATGYTWTLPTGAAITAGSNTNSITVSYSNAAISGNITVLGTNSCGNGTVSANFAVTVNALPTTPTISGATEICAGSDTTLTTTATLGTNETYLWSDNSSSSSLRVSAANTYSLRIRNTVTSCTSAVSNAIAITINNPLTFSSLGSSSTAMNSSLVITGTNLTGTTAVRFGETPARFTVNSNTQITATVPKVANTGKVSLSNACGRVLSTSIPVTRQSSSNVFSFVTTEINAIDVGYSSKPTFTDLDGDGLLDMVISGSYGTNLNHYEQDSANSTIFTLRTESFNGITGIMPTFTDLDGDGLLDMIISSYTLDHYEQVTANSTSFNLITADFCGLFGYAQIPTFTDLDGDGLLDMIVGAEDGTLKHYEQNTANNTSFTLVTANFNGIDVGSNSAPTFTDLDGDGLLDMLVGEYFGNINHYEQSAANSTSFTLRRYDFSGIQLVDRAVPTFTDIDGDGLLDMIVGEFEGKLFHYEQNRSPSISTLSSNSVCVGETVSITGTFLTGATSVTINGTSVVALSGVTATNITFTVPATATSGNIVVTTPNGTSNAVAMTIKPLPTLVASSGGASAVCINATTPAFVNTQSGGTWSIVPGTGTASVSMGGAVTGLTAGTVSVVYTYNNGICSNSVSSSVTVNMSAGAASSTPPLCVNTPLPNITHNTLLATGIGTATGLPTGVTASWADNTITISGTPIVAGTFNYSIPLTGGCGSANATGTIIVNPQIITAGVNGSITPVTNCGLTYTITPDPGYTIGNVLVNGVSVGAVPSYTFSIIAANQTISATFVAGCSDPAIVSFGTSMNFRAPNARFRSGRSVYLVTAAEMAAAGLQSGQAINGIGWLNTVAPGVTATGNLIVYLQNSNDASNIKSSTWSSAISGMTTVHNGTFVIPNALQMNLPEFSGGAAFTYTGGGVYVALDWSYCTGTLSTAQILACNNALVGGANGLMAINSGSCTVLTTLSSNAFRPVTNFYKSCRTNDVEVKELYSMGKLSLQHSTSHVVSAYVENNTVYPLTNIPVTLDVTGVNSVNQTVTIPSLAAGAGIVVSFTAYTPEAIGNNTVSVSVPADDNNTNNTKSLVQELTNGQIAFKGNGQVRSGGGGFDGTGSIAAKFSTVTGGVLKAVKLDFATVTTTTYRLAIYGDDNGVPSTTALYSESTDRTIAAAGDVLLTLSPAPTLPPGNFYIVVQQTNTTNMGLGYTNESPIRTNTFFYSDSSTGSSWVSSSFRFNIEAQFAYAITASAGPNGSISPAGVTTVNYGESQSYTITPDAFGVISDVKVNGISGTPLTSGSYALGGTYVFSNVTANNSIEVTFALNCINSGDPTSATAGATAICYGGNTTLTLNGGGGGSGATVTWYAGSCGGTPIGTGNGFSVSPTTDTTYYGRYEGTCSVTNTTCAQVTVSVNALPVIQTITASGSTTFCQGESINLTVDTESNIDTLPLNEVGGATLAVGLRKLKSDYAGSALRLRRSSDNQEQDFGFAGDNLDTTAISTWLDGADGFCTTLYDQSGNGGHVTQSDVNAQPIYVAAGINNKPILHFTTTQFMDNSVNYPAPFSAIYGARMTGASARLLSSKYNNWLLGYWNTLMDKAYFEGWLSSPDGSPANNDYTIYAGTGNGNLSTMYKNGTLLFSNNGGVEGPNGIQLNGTGLLGGVEFSDCDFTDVMLFGSELSGQDIAKLNTSISGYYSSNNTSSGALSYVWSNGATTPSINVSTAGDYSVTVTNASGCSATSVVTAVTVNTLLIPTITASGDTTFCSGDSVNLTTGTTALSFDGSSQYADLPALGITTDTLTMEAWVYANGVQNYSTGLIFARGATTTASGLDFAYLDSTKVGYTWNGGSWTWDGGPTYPLNSWFHVALVVEPTKATIYMNGVPYVNNEEHAPVNFADIMQLANDNCCGGRFFNGQMKEIKIWSTARTQAEVQSDITSTATNVNGLIAYYKLDEKSGTSIADASGNGNTGTLVGGPTWQAPPTTAEESQSTYAWSNGATTPSINVSTAGDYSVTVTNSNGCSATSLVTTVTVNTPTTWYADADADGYGDLGATQQSCTGVPLVDYVSNSTDCDDTNFAIYQFATFYVDADADGYTNGTASVCSGVGAPTGYSADSSGIDCDDNAYSLSNNCTTASTVNLKFYIQGYYSGSRMMTSVKLNQDYESHDTDVEDMTIELHDTVDYSLVDTAIGTLQTDGTLSVTFNTAAAGDYYIAVKGSNLVQTWSAMPQTIGNTALNYDFSTSASQAYGDNMKEVEPGVFAMYQGDLEVDDLVDLADYNVWESKYLDFAFGVESTDLNGDGLVDLADYNVWEANYLEFIFASYPF